MTTTTTTSPTGPTNRTASALDATLDAPTTFGTTSAPEAGTRPSVDARDATTATTATTATDAASATDAANIRNDELAADLGVTRAELAELLTERFVLATAHDLRDDHDQRVLRTGGFALRGGRALAAVAREHGLITAIHALVLAGFRCWNDRADFIVYSHPITTALALTAELVIHNAAHHALETSDVDASKAHPSVDEHHALVGLIGLASQPASLPGDATGRDLVLGAAHLLVDVLDADDPRIERAGREAVRDLADGFVRGGYDDAEAAEAALSELEIAITEARDWRTTIAREAAGEVLDADDDDERDNVPFVEKGGHVTFGDMIHDDGGNDAA